MIPAMCEIQHIVDVYTLMDKTSLLQSDQRNVEIFVLKVRLL